MVNGVIAATIIVNLTWKPVAPINSLLPVCFCSSLFKCCSHSMDPLRANTKINGWILLIRANSSQIVIAAPKRIHWTDRQMINVYLLKKCMANANYWEIYAMGPCHIRQFFCFWFFVDQFKKRLPLQYDYFLWSVCVIFVSVWIDQTHVTCWKLYVAQICCSSKQIAKRLIVRFCFFFFHFSCESQSQSKSHQFFFVIIHVAKIYRHFD